MLDLQELKAAIAAHPTADWESRAIDPKARFALGNEPTPPEVIDAATAAATKLSDTHEKLGAELGGPAGPSYPPSFDWRNRGVIGPVRDQEACGSCVSFATTGLVGAQAGIELGTRDLWLSEADQHFNSSHGPNCGGWNNGTSLGQVQARGIVPESVFPYDSAFDSPPQADPSDPGVWLAHSRAETFRDVNTYGIQHSTAWSGNDRKTYLSTVGPLICGFTVYQDFDHYGGGVYRHVTGNVRGGHAVLVVGYSDADQAWICRNSWGTSGWGPAPRPDGTGGGFFKIGYGECGIDNETMFGCAGVIPPTGKLHIGLSSYGNEMVAMWKGEHGDDRLFYSTKPGGNWAPQQLISGIGSSVGPELAQFNGRVYAAWKGITGDQRIWFSSFDGHAWAAQQQIQGVGTSVGPSLSVFGGRLYAAWKGIEGDQRLWWSSFDGRTWAPQQTIAGVASSIGPSIATYQGQLYAAWKGMDNDQRIWWSRFNGNAWTPQQVLPNVATSVGPSLTADGTKLYASWKGMGNDQGIWWSTFDGNAWAPQQEIPGVATSIGPTIAVNGSSTYAAWKGMDNDERLWFTHSNGAGWVPQALVGGGTCPD